MADTYAVIAGGGTAGHVIPGLAIAEELVAQGVDRDAVHYVGSARGIETRLVPEAGFPLTVLPGRGIQRRLALENVRSVFGLIAAVITGIRLVRRLRPAVVVGLGGYASVPCVIGAVLWRVPIVVAEQNAVPGAANRLAGRFAKACAVSFDGTDLPRATWTGNPAPSEVVAARFSRLRSLEEAAQALAQEGGEVEVSEPGGFSSRTIAFLTIGMTLLFLIGLGTNADELVSALVCLGLPLVLLGLFVAARYPRTRMHWVTVRVPALVTSTRSEGGWATVYYTTLQGEDGERRECRSFPRLAGQLAVGDVGIASFAGSKLVDFERFDA